MESSNIIHDAAALTNDVAATCNRSTKLTNILHSIQALKHDRASLQPLCPSRVLIRGAALETVLDQHESIVQALSEYAETNSEETVSKARGLLKQIKGGEFVLGIVMYLSAINLLENLNKTVQSQSFAISGAVAAMEVTYKGLEGMRTEEAFHGIFACCIIRCEELGVEAPNLPRVRNRPKRYEVGLSANHLRGSGEDYFRVQYFKFLDTAMIQLKKKYDLHQAGERHCEACDQLLGGNYCCRPEPRAGWKHLL